MTFFNIKITKNYYSDFFSQICFLLDTQEFRVERLPKFAFGIGFTSVVFVNISIQ